MTSHHFSVKIFSVVLHLLLVLHILLILLIHWLSTLKMGIMSLENEGEAGCCTQNLYHSKKLLKFCKPKSIWCTKANRSIAGKWICIAQQCTHTTWPTAAWHSFIPKPHQPAIKDVGAGGIPHFPWLPPLASEGREMISVCARSTSWVLLGIMHVNRACHYLLS